jgi:PKD repeat protein
VCVDEYRNGVLISTHHRDFQFNVIPCVINVVSAIQSQSQFCAGLTVNFGNESFGNNGNLTYTWDFGDPNSLIDNSTSTSPSYTYPIPGTYTVTLIATQQPGGCSDTSYNVFDVQPLLDIEFDAPDGGQCLVGNNFTFNGGGNYQGNGTISWDFGPNATPQTANSATVTNVTFNAPGRYPIRKWLRRFYY